MLDSQIRKRKNLVVLSEATAYKLNINRGNYLFFKKLLQQ